MSREADGGKLNKYKLGLSLIRRKFDIVMAWSVDRLRRSLQDLIGFLSELLRRGFLYGVQVWVGMPTQQPMRQYPV
jgi:hypothetical protein